MASGIYATKIHVATPCEAWVCGLSKKPAELATHPAAGAPRGQAIRCTSGIEAAAIARSPSSTQSTGLRIRKLQNMPDPACCNIANAQIIQTGPEAMVAEKPTRLMKTRHAPVRTIVSSRNSGGPVSPIDSIKLYIWSL